MDKKDKNKTEWNHVSGRIDVIKKKFGQIIKIAPDIDRADINKLELMKKQLEDLIIEIHEVMGINYNYFVKKNVEVHDHFETLLVSLENRAYDRIWKAEHAISSKKKNIKNKRKSENKFEYIFRDSDALENREISEDALLINAHRALDKKTNMIPKAGLNSLSETDSEILYYRISRCINNYKNHYGEMPTSQMVSDILNIPEDLVENVMGNNMHK